MKKIILLLTALFLFTISANAGVFTSVSGLLADKVKPTAEYVVDTAGENVRVYEFDTKDGRHCVMVFTESKYKSPPMQCWEKK